jgi:hypothetical protein
VVGSALTFEMCFICEEKAPLKTGASIYTSWRLGVLQNDAIPENFSTYGESVDKGRLYYNDPLGRNIDLEYNRTPLDVIDVYVKLFLYIKPKEVLLKKINYFSKLFDDDTVSMNIRSWNDDAYRRKQYFNFEAYVVEMKKLPSNTKFFITSDLEVVKAQLARIFPGRVLTYSRKTEVDASRTSVLGMQEGLIELYLTSKNKLIIGSFLSTFTEVAWWLGGAKAKVILPLPNNNTRYYV